MTENRSRETVELRKSRNALLPISRLPDSVLAEIFDCHRKLHSAEKLIMLQVTHVCYSWRATAFSYGKLWTDVCVLCPDQVRHWLARSARCLLDVASCGRYPYSPEENVRSDGADALCLVLEELPRIRTLWIDPGEVWFTREQLSKSCWTNPPASSPFLQSLLINATAHAYSKDLDSPFCLTELFLRRDLPSLTELNLVDIRFLSSNIYFPRSLRQLSILNMDSAGAWNPDIASVILATVDALPSLESLHLKWDDHEDAPTAVPVVARQVTLSHLRELTLRTHSQHRLVSDLLNHLTYPSAARVYLFVGHHAAIDRTFMAAVGSKLNGRGLIGDIRPMRDLVFRRDDKLDCIFVLTGCDNDTVPRFRISVQLGGSTGSRNLAAFIGMTCDTLPLLGVRILIIDGICLELRAETFISISQNMPALEALSIHGWAYKGPRPTCLFTGAPVDVEGLFPNLSDIVLHDLSHYKETIGFWEFLIEILASRHESGVPLDSLSLLGCDDVDPDCITLLQGLVDELVWNPTGDA